MNNDLVRPAKLLTGVGPMVQDKPGGEVGEVPRLSTLSILQEEDKIIFTDWLSPELCKDCVHMQGWRGPLGTRHL